MRSRRHRDRSSAGRPCLKSAAALAGLLALVAVAAVCASVEAQRTPLARVSTSDAGQRGGPAIEQQEPSWPPADQAHEGESASSEPTQGTQASQTLPEVGSVRTYPEQMDHLLPGSTQLIVITGARLGSNTGVLRVFNKESGRWRQVLETPANFGRNGLVDGETRVSGHLNTPTGIWRIGAFVFGQHSQPPPGTKMPYRAITPHSWWSAEHDRTYNTWVESRSHVVGERLRDATVPYEYAFDSGYNAPPNERVVGRGTAIFIHCFEPAGNALGDFTHGCVAIAPSAMLRLFSLLDPARRPACAIGTEDTGTETAIYSY